MEYNPFRFEIIEKVMPTAGFEPAHGFPPRILSPLCLPVSPRRLIGLGGEVCPPALMRYYAFASLSATPSLTLPSAKSGDSQFNDHCLPPGKVLHNLPER